RDVGITAAVAFRAIGDRLQLRGRERAAGNAQAAHERLLRGSDVEQSVEAEAEVVGARGQLVAPREFAHVIPELEGVALVLDLLFLRQPLARGEPGEPGLVSGGFLFGVGERGGGCGCRRIACDGDAAQETLEVFFLVGGKSAAGRRTRILWSQGHWKSFMEQDSTKGPDGPGTGWMSFDRSRRGEANAKPTLRKDLTQSAYQAESGSRGARHPARDPETTGFGLFSTGFDAGSGRRPSIARRNQP